MNLSSVFSGLLAVWVLLASPVLAQAFKSLPDQGAVLDKFCTAFADAKPGDPLPGTDLKKAIRKGHVHVLGNDCKARHYFIDEVGSITAPYDVMKAARELQDKSTLLPPSASNVPVCTDKLQVICFQPMTAHEISNLPQEVASEFRQTDRYRREGPRVDAWLAQGNNCASFALDKWNDLSFSGDRDSDGRLLRSSEGEVQTCTHLVSLLLKNPRLNAYPASQERCEQGGYIVVPLALDDEQTWLEFFESGNGHLKRGDTHLIRQLPDERFANVQGPNLAISWVWYRDANGLRRPVTKVEQLESPTDYTRCPSVCVRPQAVAASSGEQYRGAAGNFRVDRSRRVIEAESFFVVGAGTWHYVERGGSLVLQKIQGGNLGMALVPQDGRCLSINGDRSLRSCLP